jgi:competence protein ComGC
MRDAKGFTLIEIMFALLTAGFMAVSLALPVYLDHVDKAKERVCISNRRVVEHAEELYFFDNGTRSSSFQELVDRGYLKEKVECPAGGIYAWMPGEADYIYLTCSLHGATIEKLTPLGSTFKDITAGFIDLLRGYKDLNGKYPDGNWKKTLKTIGFDPEDWENGVNGIKYRPAGGVLNLLPDENYVFSVIDSKGKRREPGRIIYSLENDTSYYGKDKKGKEIDISTFDVQEK